MGCSVSIPVPLRIFNSVLLSKMDEILFLLTGDTKTYTNHYVFNQKIIDRLDDLVTFCLETPQTYAKQFSFCGDILIRLNDILLHYSQTIPNEKNSQTQLLKSIDIFCDLLTDGTVGVTFVPDMEWMEANGVTIVDNHVVFPSVYDYEMENAVGCSNYVIGKTYKYLGCKILLRLNYMIQGLLGSILPGDLEIDAPLEDTVEIDDDIIIHAYVTPNNATNKEIDYLIENENIFFVSLSYEIDGEGYKVYTFKFHVNNIDSGSSTKITLSANGNASVSKEILYNITILPETLEVDVPLENTVQIGDGIVIHAYVTPNDATNQNIDYSIENENISLVSQSSAIDGEGYNVYTFNFHVNNADSGSSTKITLSANGDASVFKEILYNITILPEMLEVDVPLGNNVEIDDDIIIHAYVTPNNATNKDIDYSIENENISLVSQSSAIDGGGYKVYTFNFHVNNAESGSSTKITLSADGDASVFKEILYNITIFPETVAVDVPLENNVEIDDDIIIHAYITPNNVTNKDIDYSIENENISFVSQSSEIDGEGYKVYTFNFHVDNRDFGNSTLITLSANANPAINKIIVYNILE